MIHLRYGISITEDDYNLNIKRLTNQIYKLLPMREEKQEWQKFLEMLMFEIEGLDALLGNQANFLPLVSKLESLFLIDDFVLYRKTIFECLGLIGKFTHE